MITSVETITPEQARDLLEKNTRNRPLRRSRVEAIARDILSGNYLLTHQAIGIAPTFIVDGQHRLAAIVEAGVSVQLSVTMYETDEEGMSALLVVDKMSPRSDADVQVLAGVMSKDLAKMIVPIIKVCARAGLPTTAASGSAHIMTTEELPKWYIEEKAHVDWAVTTLNDPEASRRFNAANRAAFAIGHMVDSQRIERLAVQVVAADSTQGEVAHAWNKASAQGKLSISQNARSEGVLSLSLRLIQADLQGTEVPKSLKASLSTIEWYRTRIAKIRGVNPVLMSGGLAVSEATDVEESKNDPKTGRAKKKAVADVG